MPLILASNSASGGYEVDISLRFNSGSSDYLNRTPASASNRKTWTWSGWVKLLGTNMYLFGASSDSWFANYSTVWITSDAELRTELEIPGSSGSIVSTNLFRDPSAWYHFVVAVDTTQATANNRVRMYVNGVEVAYTTQTMPAQNSDTMINSAQYHQISGRPSTNYLNGYLAEINLIDGQQLTPSSFGQTDSATGIWTPKAYTGAYGTNGFYLPFETITTSGFSSYYGSFNGTTQSLSVTDSTAFNMGTGNFTVEGFFKFDTVDIWDMVNFLNAGVVKQVFYYYSPTGELSFYDAISGFTLNPSFSFQASTWYHIAWVENSNTFTIYVNGNSIGSTTSTALNITGNTSIIFGKNATRNSAAGQISNLRIVKGTAVYTSNFTPPTSPLTNVSGTSLLTLQDATIIDNSSNAFSITNTGSVATTSSSSINSQTTFANDFSGNNNNFTANNLTSVDQSTDTPTNNFATLNPLDAGGGGSYAQGNLQYTSATSDLKASASSFALNNGGAGKWYWEVKMVSTTGSIYQIGTISSTSGYNASPHSQYSSGGQVYINGSLVTTVATYTTNDIISVAFDATISEVKFYKNGSLQTTQTITNSSNILMFAGSHSDSSGNTATYQFNFGSPPFTIASGNADANGYGNFEYAVPSGYYALCTKNLAIYG